MHLSISNTPIGPIADLRAQNGGVPPADDVYVRLMQIRNARKPVTIRTSLDTFNSMALKSLSVPRTSATGDCLECTAVFQQIDIVKNTRGPRVAIPGAKGGGSRTKPPVPVKPKTANFTDTLPLVKVYRKNGEWLWLDENIGGWRYSALHDAPINTHDAPESTAITAPIGTNPYRREQEGWVVYRDRVYGLTVDEWYSDKKAGKTDAQYREDINTAYERANLGGYALNKYDPFIDFGTGGDASNAYDIRVVHAIRK